MERLRYKTVPIIINDFEGLFNDYFSRILRRIHNSSRGSIQVAVIWFECAKQIGDKPFGVSMRNALTGIRILLPMIGLEFSRGIDNSKITRLITYPRFADPVSKF